MDYKTLFSLVVFTFLLSSCVNKTPEISFIDVNLIPMDHEVILNHQTVTIHNSKIVKIEPALSAEISDDAIRIDGIGKYLMPGLADMHVHTWNKNDLILFLANGVTTIRNMGGDPFHLDLKRKIHDGELLGPNMYTAGPVIDGFPALFPKSIEVEGPLVARKVISEQKEAGYDFIKIYNNLSESGFNAVMAVSKELKMPVSGHVPFSISLEEALESGMSSIEHFEGYGIYLQSDNSPFVDNIYYSMTYTWTQIDEKKLNIIVKKTKESGIWNCPTMVVFQNLFIKPADIIKMLNRKEMQYVPESVKEQCRKRNYNEEIAQHAEKIHTARTKLLSELYNAGANILLGTDCGNLFTVPGFSIHRELQNLIDAGYSPYEALKTGTTNASAYFNESKIFGSVKIGHRADLLLLEENPLEDVSNLKKMAGVMIRGKWLPKEELKMKMQKISKEYRNKIE
jgi:cytosine/adenosine deaminase-related metal-dependent hydrolase